VPKKQRGGGGHTQQVIVKLEGSSRAGKRSKQESMEGEAWGGGDLRKGGGRNHVHV